MTRNRIGLWGCAALLALAAPAVAADPVKEAEALAARIDQHLAKAYATNKVTPASLADDAEFFRRVWLDLGGRIPDLTEARRFLDSRVADKRRKAIDALLKSPHYVKHYTAVWRALFLPEANANLQTRFAAPQFEQWLSSHLKANTPYDQIVRELLTVPVAGGAGRGAIQLSPGGTGAAVFYQANDYQPENLAAATSRLFLGVKLGCAQCHDHPFAKWKKEEFWSYAAFFGGIRSRRQGDFVQPDRELADKHEIAIPGTDRVAQAKYLDGSKPAWKEKQTARDTLADWVTSDKNPYFARATVNRLWSQFFGSGLVDPVDEMVGTEASAAHPELLDELSKEFIAHKYDLKFLIRAIVSSQAYQRTSARSHKSQDDPRQFAKMALRGLTPEQLYDSLTEAVGTPTAQEQRNDRGRAFIIGGNGPRDEFLSKFANSSDRPTEVQTSILQALALMNGKFVSDATSVQDSVTLAGVIDAPWMKTSDKIEALYLAALSRKPRANELERLVKYVEKGGPSGDKDKALADVFWVLLNGSEFILNH
jgi:Protein of unknown function (DUF1553)/Protein of unknown function (DUF1549)